MPKENKVTKAEKAQRVQKVYELMVAGATRYQIHAYANGEKANWNLSERQIDNYIAAAAALITTEAEYQRPKELGRAIAALNDLYQRCMKVQDYARALSTRRELNQLLGLYAPPAAQTLRIEGLDTTQLQVLTDAVKQRGGDVNAIIAAMLRRLESDHV